MHPQSVIRSRWQPHVALLAFIVGLCLVFIFGGVSSCQGPGGASSVIGYATLSGNGDARVDMRGTGIALGNLHGSTGIYMQGSGFPLTIPIDIAEGTWVEFVKGKPARHGDLNVDPIPFERAAMYRPGELDAIATQLGYPSILVEQFVQPSPQPPPESQPGPVSEPLALSPQP